MSDHNEWSQDTNDMSYISQLHEYWIINNDYTKWLMIILIIPWSLSDLDTHIRPTYKVKVQWIVSVEW